MKIWVNTLVQNEDKFLWFAVSSVIDCVDHIVIWETGSTDNTLQIMKALKKIYKDKVSIKSVGSVSVVKYPEIRTEMLNSSKADWVILVDGDEVWWNEKIKKIVNLINKKGDKLDSIVNRYINLVGDIYHYQPEEAAKYKIDGVEGNLTIRAMNLKIPGLRFDKPHGQLGIVDDKGVLIQNQDKKRRFFLDEVCYVHLTHLKRSSGNDKNVPKRSFKYKHDLGIQLPGDYYYPEAFFQKRPVFVSNPWFKRSIKYLVVALIFTPLKVIKRKIPLFEKSGY